MLNQVPHSLTQMTKNYVSFCICFETTEYIAVYLLLKKKQSAGNDINNEKSDTKNITASA